MYLKTLYIQGFKSFANKTKIDFNNSITGIVGPNGSGKSNISDAIMWVLGETSIKSLRGSKMEDVIFSGTDKRKPLGFAEITIVLDNSNRDLPIEFNEVSVTRKMYRSLESEFYINKTKCRLKDIKELFMDTGIGKDGYSLIGQGRIESILSTKPDQRRAIFEEAAGISKFKMRKNESERKLEKTKENLIRLNDIISEIEKRKDLLYEQSKDAVKYREYYEELKNLDISIAAKDISRKEDNINSIKEEILKLKEDLNNKNENIQEFKENEAIVEKEILELEEKISRNQDFEIENNKKLEQMNSEINLYTEKIIFSEQKKENLENQIVLLNEDNKNDSEKINLLKLEIERYLEDFNEKKELKINFEAALKEKEEELKNIEISENENNENFLGIHKKINEIVSKCNLTESILKEKKDRINSLDNNLSMLEDSNKELNTSIDSYLEKYSGLKSINTDLLEQKTINDNYLKELEKLLSKITDDLYSVKNKYEEKNAKFNALKNITENYDGYSKSVKNFMNITQKRSLFKKSLLGTVADKLSVSEEYEKAISIALGGSVQNLIIESEKDAKEMIAFLTKENLGRVTFLPLDSITYNANKINLDTLKDDSILGFADELISYDEKYKNIFKNLLGKIIISKDFNSAVNLSKKLNRSYRIVTLAGDSLNVGGSITGGSIYKNNINILGRSNELKDLKAEVDNSIIEYNSILKSYNEKKSKIEELKFNSSNLFNRLEESSKNLLSTENQIESLKSSRNNNQIYLDKYKNEINDLKKSIEEDYEKINKFNLEKEELDLERKKLEEISSSSKNNLSNLKNDLEKVRNSYGENNIEYTKLESLISSSEKEISNIESIIEKNNLKIKDFNLEIDKVICEINDFKIKSDDLNSNLENFKLEIESLSKLLIEDKNLKKEKSLYLSKLRENINEYTLSVNSIEKTLDKKEYNIDKINLELENIINNICNEYRIEKSQIEEIVDLKSIKETRDRILELKNMIDALGEVNILAIEEYEQVKERLEFNNTQKKDLLDSIDEIKNILNELDVEMNKKFKETFKLISEYFNDIFKILFNGGRAEIEIDGDDPLTAGIEIKAQPPGKRFQSLSLLSGGERALTAVALLFALLKVRPAPFCILDEIDAALDDANIKRYTDYLMTLEEIQFIMITHRKTTMEIANKLYGVTMEEKGISKLISVELTK